jgi:hypothetical protein
VTVLRRAGSGLPCAETAEEHTFQEEAARADAEHTRSARPEQDLTACEEAHRCEQQLDISLIRMPLITEKSAQDAVAK